MRRLDVLTSLLRSGARAAQAGLRTTAIGASLRRLATEIGLRRVTISDAELTRAVTRVLGLTSATVHSDAGRLLIDVSFGDAERLALTLIPRATTFAPGGAKELSFAVEPNELANDLRSLDICAAICGVIARSLWRPALARAPRSEQGASVSHQQGMLIVDLRSVPEVRWALRQALPTLLIEAIRLRALEVEHGQLVLTLALDRLG